MPNPTPNQAWTPEPWTVNQCEEANSDKNEACGLNGQEFDSSRDRCAHWAPLNDLTRAVACVNALVGIKDPAAYLEALRQTASAAEILVRDIETDIDGCYDLGHNASLKYALSALRKQEQP